MVFYARSTIAVTPGREEKEEELWIAVTERKSFCKKKKETKMMLTAVTHHWRTNVHVDIHIICDHGNGLPRFGKRPV